MFHSYAANFAALWGNSRCPVREYFYSPVGEFFLPRWGDFFYFPVGEILLPPRGNTCSLLDATSVTSRGRQKRPLCLSPTSVRKFLFWYQQGSRTPAGKLNVRV